MLAKRLSLLKAFFKTHRRIPTYREAALLWKLASSNAAFKIMQKFIERGYLEKDSYGKLRPTNYFFSIPVHGLVPAGFPIPVEENQPETLSIQEYLIDKPNAMFLLRVKGDSLKNAGILPNDLVLIEKGAYPKQGDVVLAHVDGEWTLKIFDKTNGRVRLMPANKKYKPIIPSHKLEIYGVVRSVIRKYE